MYPLGNPGAVGHDFGVGDEPIGPSLLGRRERSEPFILFGPKGRVGVPSRLLAKARDLLRAVRAGQGIHLAESLGEGGPQGGQVIRAAKREPKSLSGGFLVAAPAERRSRDVVGARCGQRWR